MSDANIYCFKHSVCGNIGRIAFASSDMNEDLMMKWTIFLLHYISYWLVLVSTFQVEPILLCWTFMNVYADFSMNAIINSGVMSCMKYSNYVCN